MKRLVCILMVLTLGCGVVWGDAASTVKWTGAGGDTSWFNNSNWLRFGDAGWAGGQAYPAAWQRAYIGKEMTGDVVVLINNSAQDAQTEAFYIGMDVDPVTSVTVNISAGSVLNSSGYVASKAESKTTFNLDGVLTMQMPQFNGATVNINDGATMRIYNQYWKMLGDTTINIAEGGKLSIKMDSGYGAAGRTGLVNLEGGVVKFDGNQLSVAESYISGGFVTAYNGDSNYSLESSYDSAANATYISVVPEPATLVLLGLGSSVLTLRRRRR